MSCTQEPTELEYRMPGKVLLIDDNVPRRISLRSSLILSFYDVTVGDNPTEALKSVAQQGIDIVLIAADLVKTCGYALCNAIKSAYSQEFLPVLVLAAEAPINWNLARSNQVDDVLPIAEDTGALMQRLRQLYRAKGEFDALQLHFDAIELQGIAEPNFDFHYAERAKTKIAILLKDVAFTEIFVANMRSKLHAEFSFFALDDYKSVHPDTSLILLLDSEQMNDHHLRILSNIQQTPVLKSLPTVCLCGATAPDTCARAVEFGAVDCLNAEFPMDRIALRITATLRAQHMTKRLRGIMSTRIKEAVTDPLTGVYNRRYCERYLRRALAPSEAAPSNLVLMMIDVDNFKILNDRYGHPEGDAVLRQVGDLLRANMRGSDMIARVGGDEFMVVLPDIPNHTAKLLAERVRRLIGADIKCGPPPATSPTISIGLAASEGVKTDMMTLWSAADKALYLAKKQGRNKIEFRNIAA